MRGRLHRRERLSGRGAAKAEWAAANGLAARGQRVLVEPEMRSQLDEVARLRSGSEPRVDELPANDTLRVTRVRLVDALGKVHNVTSSFLPHDGANRSPSTRKGRVNSGLVSMASLMNRRASVWSSRLPGMPNSSSSWT